MVMVDKKSVFFSGCAGTGKSTVLKVIEMMEMKKGK
jgi:ABC-type ATPase involved in cell division